MRSAFCLLASFATLALACGDDTASSGGGGADAAPLSLLTDSGPIEGALLGRSRVFLGIPYAAPPVGPLRWRAPAPLTPWQEPRKTIARGPTCAQASPLDGAFAIGSSEDCLTLNVWTPERPDTEPLPVFVWIHGGGYILGSGGDSAYDGQVFSEATRSVVVTINYRLGPFGFLALPELDAEDASHPTSGNYGLEDQRAALAWVKANAAVFGGDPSRVTIFGESAGGASVCQHLVSPGSKGLFARAIIESGPCNLVKEQAKAFAQGAEMATALACSGTELLSCLRSKSTEEVITALPAQSFGLGMASTTWAPTIDGLTLPDKPLAMLEQGSFERMPTILGANSDEGTLFFQLAGSMVNDEAAFRMLAEQLVPGEGAEIVSRYPASEYGSVEAAAAAAVSDAGFVCPTRRAARALAAGGASTWQYHYQYGPPSLFGELGAFHSAEIKFVLGNPGPLLPLPLTDEEIAFSRSIQTYWSALGSAGDPNSTGGVVWPRYDLASDTSLVLDLTITTVSGLRAVQCDYWDTVETNVF
ncbi:MAG: carboxylesterase family protein [Myxococcales bacterium]|nr:carboxylesterase family protein [Myxococcales bacterium]